MGALMVRIRGYFVTGLAVFLPATITVYLLVALFRFFDNVLGRLIRFYFWEHFGFYIPGTGIVLFILVVFTIGFFIKHLLGGRGLSFLEKLLGKIPLVKTIYPAAKQIINFIVLKDWRNFKGVVLLEYPRKGLYSVGFITGEGFSNAHEKTGRSLVTVLIPSAPSPLTGYIILVPREELIFLDISIEDGLRLVISNGVVTPDNVTTKTADS